MTTPVEAVRFIEQHFEANFVACDKAYDNEPAGVERTHEYAKLTIQVGDGQPNLDSTYTRLVGLAIVQIRVPKGLGSIRAWDLATIAAQVLELRAVNGVRLTSAGYANAGLIDGNNVQDAGWHVINVNIPFWFEHYS